MTAARCINALNAAAGRQLTDTELEAVFGKIQKTARDIAAGRVVPTGPHNLSSPDGVMRAAAEFEAQALIEKSQLELKRARLAVAVTAERRADAQTIRAAGLPPIEAVRRMVVNDADGRADTFSLEARALGIEKLLKSRIQDTWKALGDDFLGFFQDRDKARLLIREMRGENTGDALAKKGARQWLDEMEQARVMFNDRGGNIGRLEDWGLPQHHSQERVARAGRDAWVNDQMQWVDRSRYVEIDGNQMTEPQIRAFMESAWETIATNGVSKMEPGRFAGTGARSNRGSEERQIHYKDADSVLANWEKYGEKTLPDILMGHVESIAKNIAFVEHFGPNPDATYRLLRDEAYKAQVEADPVNLDKADGALAKLERLYNYASGKTLPVANQSVARGFRVVHNLNVAGKLGSAFWSSLFGDKVMYEAIGHVNNLPPLKRWYNEVRLLNPANKAERDLLRQHAMMLDYMGNAMYRFGDELGASSLTGKLATAVMRVTGMSAVNEWRRGAWALTAMSSIGRTVGRKKWGAIGKDDMRLLQSYGITEADWNIWRLAKPDDLGHGNDTALTPEAIARIPDADIQAAVPGSDPERARSDAIIKLLGALTSESNIAVLEPGWNDRARMYGGLQRGNFRDELTRSFWQFKAFPIAQFERMLDIGLSRPTLGGKAGFLMAVPVLQTIAGAMMLQVQDLLAGKDPRPMNTPKFWAAAAMKGGSLGLYGDFLYSQSATTRYGTGPLEAIAGPTIGSAADILKFAVQAGNAAAAGETDQGGKLGAKALNIAKGFVPGQNMWMTKWATDHLIFQQAQEMLNPGYLDAMRARTQAEFGQEWWLPPGASFEEMRAPMWENVVEGGP